MKHQYSSQEYIYTDRENRELVDRLLQLPAGCALGHYGANWAVIPKDGKPGMIGDAVWYHPLGALRMFSGMEPGNPFNTYSQKEIDKIRIDALADTTPMPDDLPTAEDIIALAKLNHPAA